MLFILSLKKKVIERMPIFEYYYISLLVPFVFTILYIILTQKKFTFYQRLTYEDYKNLIIMLFFYFIGNLIFIDLLNRDNVTDVLPLTDPLKLIFILMISQTIFFEKLVKTQIYGILIIAIGMLVFNCETILKSSQIKTTN